MNTEPYIIKGIGGFYYVKTADGVVECRAKGIFRKRGITPVAGDRVRLEHEAGTAVIAEVLPRKNVFVRPPVANVDQFFIVASTVQPAPSQTRLPTVMGRAISSPSTRSSGSMGCSAVVKQQLGPTNTLSPKRTSAPSVMMRSWFE